MKKAISVMLTIILFIGMCSACGWYDTHYDRKNCEVIKATEEGCIILDKTGNTWFWEESGWNVGDKVLMKMHTNNTGSFIDDDEILKVIKMK